MTDSLPSTKVSSIGVTVILAEAAPAGMLNEQDNVVGPLNAVPGKLEVTVKDRVVSPERLIVKRPVSGPVSDALASVAATVTVGLTGAESLSEITIIPALGDPTV